MENLQAPNGVALVRYDAMCKAIAECHGVDEVKDLRDKAKAIEVYARQARNYNAERQAAEIRIRAERRAGELLREMKDRGELQKRGDNGGHNRKQTSSNTTSASAPTLPNLSITRDQSPKWRESSRPTPVTPQPPPPPPPTLLQLGITRDQSSKWQQLAAVPAEEFERAVKGSGGKPSTDGMINTALLRGTPQPRMDPDALWP